MHNGNAAFRAAAATAAVSASVVVVVGGLSEKHETPYESKTRKND